MEVLLDFQDGSMQKFGGFENPHNARLFKVWHLEYIGLKV